MGRLIRQIELSAAPWFNIAWLAISPVFVCLMLIHLRRKLAIVPESWVGKGQLIYVVLLWIMVIADFERSLNGFHESLVVYRIYDLIEKPGAQYRWGEISCRGRDKPCMERAATRAKTSSW